MDVVVLAVLVTTLKYVSTVFVNALNPLAHQIVTEKIVDLMDVVAPAEHVMVLKHVALEVFAKAQDLPLVLQQPPLHVYVRVQERLVDLMDVVVLVETVLIHNLVTSIQVNANI
jgi:hypothetical protein